MIREDLIFVMGCQRSGTTLMAQLLGTQKNAILLDENDGIYEWLFLRIKGGPTTQASNLLRKCLKTAISKYSDDGRFGGAFDIENRIPRAVLKVPNMTYFPHEIKAAFPSAKIVFMLRDIRAVVSSILNLKSVNIFENQLRYLREPNISALFSDEDLNKMRDSAHLSKHSRIAQLVMMKMSLFRTFQDIGLNPNIVKYEDLILSTEATIGDLTQSLNIPQAINWSSFNEVFKGSGPGGMDRKAPISTNSIARWKKVFTIEQENQIWDICGEFMASIGYAFNE